MGAVKTFDPAEFIRNDIKFRGNTTNEYLEAKWAIAWLRSEYPRANLETEKVSIDPDPKTGHAIFRTVVELVSPEGEVIGSATGWGSETPADFKDFIEKAETKSIRRALNHVGLSKEVAAPEIAASMGYDDPTGKQANGPQARPASHQEVTQRNQDQNTAPPTAPEWGDTTKPPEQWTGTAAFWKRAIDDFHAGRSKSTPEQIQAKFKEVVPPQQIHDYFVRQADVAAQKRAESK